MKCTLTTILCFLVLSVGSSTAFAAKFEISDQNAQIDQTDGADLNGGPDPVTGIPVSPNNVISYTSDGFNYAFTAANTTLNPDSGKQYFTRNRAAGYAVADKTTVGGLGPVEVDLDSWAVPAAFASADNFEWVGGS
jgi:hypothetical protein